LREDVCKEAGILFNEALFKAGIKNCESEYCHTSEMTW